MRYDRPVRSMSSAEELGREKDLAARAAIRRVRPGAKVALGTGSTAAYAVRALAEKFPRGGPDCVSSSQATAELATSLGLSVRPLNEDDEFDAMLDGADEVDPRLRMTKGGGGALLREKVLAKLSKEVLILVDHTKLVPRLGTRSSIPVEVVPFARPAVVRHLKAARIASVLRSGPDGIPRLTDNGNELLDLTPPGPLEDPAELERDLRAIPGIVETGLFLGLASRVYVGLPDGTVEEILPGPAPRTT
jgi:ribose 5-phosphate isomerase A